MIGVVWTICWRLALGLGFAWLAFKWGGAISFVFGLGLLGVLLARPLVDLASELRHAMRRAVWQPEAGRFFAYKGRTIHVAEDPDHCRWVRVDDLRRVVGFTASDGALALSYPSGCRMLGQPPALHLSDEALLLHLAKERGDDAIRFRNWSEREIAFPAQRERERLGIRLRAPTAPAED